jgi:hypothetical protein
MALELAHFSSVSFLIYSASVQLIDMDGAEAFTTYMLLDLGPMQACM